MVMLASEGKRGAGGLGLSNSISKQMVLKRVVSVILDDSHRYYEGADTIGTIYYEDPYGSINIKGGKPEAYDPKNYAKPITPNNQFYPLIGELVFLVSTMSNKPFGQNSTKQYKSQNY